MGKSDAAIDKLTEKVSAMEVAVDGGVTLIQGLAAQMREVADDPDQINALADRVDAKAQEMAQAIVDNTPAA